MNITELMELVRDSEIVVDLHFDKEHGVILHLVTNGNPSTSVIEKFPVADVLDNQRAVVDDAIHAHVAKMKLPKKAK